jgi:hypothetical protein
MMRVSAKQLNMFGCRTRKEGALDGCARKWAAYYLDGNKPDFLPEPLVFGIKFHAVCAAMVKTGRMPAPGVLQPGVVLMADEVAPDGLFGKMARSAIIHLPRTFVKETGDQIRAWQTEQEWLFPWTTTRGTEVQIDLRPDVCADSTLVDLIDWKSTSAKRWALTSILDDVQAQLYASGLMIRFNREVCAGRWIYVEKRAPHKSWPVDGIFHRAASAQWLHHNVDPTIDLIAMMREHRPAAMDLPGDVLACEGVGKRCDFGGHCLGPVGPKESRLITLEEIVRYKEGR